MRISFSIYDADHIHELALESFQKGCCVCDNIKKRLEKFIGAKRVRASKMAVKNRPYYFSKEEKLLLKRKKESHKKKYV